MFNIGDEVIARRTVVGGESEYEGTVVSATESAKIIAKSHDLNVYGALERTIFNMMKSGVIFIKVIEKSFFDNSTYEDIRYFSPNELTHKYISKEYAPDQNGDTEDDV